MSKHTPGPWHIRHCDDNGCMSMTAISAVPVPAGNVDCYEDRDPDDMIAIVFHQSEPFVRPEDRKGERVANAALIAAAPDLLAALDAMVAVFGCECDSEIVIARAAIAKARGEK